MNWNRPAQASLRLRGPFAAILLLSLLFIWGPAKGVEATDDFAGLTAAIQAANGGSREITLRGDITLSAVLPPITGSLTIDGGGHSISGNDAYRIFDVDGGALTVSNATLTKANAGDGWGGAIRLRNGARLVIENSTLSQNRAKSGGAIYANGGSVSVKNSRFEENCSQLASFELIDEDQDRDSRSADAGGCVRVQYRRTEISSDVGTNVDGGAIRLFDGARAEIESSTFIGNQATYGGAISTASSNVQLSISDSSFVANRASESGGAIGANWKGGGRVSISRSSFVENSAMRGGGGAIESASHTLDITNSTFSENVAYSVGGALSIDEDSDVTITHATFVENRSRWQQAATISNTGGTVNLRNSLITRSGSGEDCVGEGEHVGNLSLDGSCADRPSDDPRLGELTGSPAYYPLRDRSPAIDYADPDYCLETDQLGTPRPQGGGCDIGAIEARGAIAAEPTPVPPLVCTLAFEIVAANRDRPASGCPAGSGVDTISLDKDIILFEPLPAITSHIVIEGNGHSISGDGKSRIFDVDGGMLTVKNLTMTEGNARNGNGGAIRLQNGGRLRVSNSRLTNNIASTGGAIYIPLQGADSSWVNVRDSGFIENRSTNGGGAIYAGSGTVSVSNSSFVMNSAGGIGGGGALQLVNYSTRLDVVNSSFISSRTAAVAAENGVIATLTHVTVQTRGNAISTSDSRWTTAGSFNVRNSILVGSVPDLVCDNLKQNISNLIKDGSCSPRLSGDPMLEDAPTLAAYLVPQPGSPAINAADARFCPDTDQLGRARSIVGRCDIGAIEAVPVSQSVSDCTVTTTHLLNLRDSPSGTVIGGVPQHAAVNAVARTPRWFQVEHDGKTGWISALYVVEDGDCNLN